jgi:UDP-glucuronate decarboxylase
VICLKVLITGGAGFLGSHLSKLFLESGHEVLAFDDLSTGSIENISEFDGDPRFQFIRGDVRDSLSIESDLILNFACPASPVHYQSDPVKTIETNFLGMANVLKLAKKTGARVLQASTSEVYGDPNVSPQPESYWGNVNSMGIRSCYDEGKRAAEALCFDYKRQYNVDVRVVRIFNTYGPKMMIEDGRVVSNFIVQALEGNDITVYGEGMQSRSFCFVEDLVKGIEKVAISKISLESAVNLGNNNEFTMLELAEKVLKAVGSNSKLTFMPLPMDDPKQRCPDLTFAKKYFDWEAKIPLETGIPRTVDYFRKRLSQ